MENVWKKVYIENDSFLLSAQHGFRAARSTTTNLLMTDKYLAEWQNSGNDYDIMSFDLTKAFDCVQHGLMRRLQQLNFHHTETQWFTSFLARRKQYVCQGSACSS